MTSIRRRKHPQHQQLIAMRQLDSVPATGSAAGVTSSGKMATKTTENAAKMSVKKAVEDADALKKDRRPSLVDLRNVLSLDDFDAFCVQASSGGSIYGMLRKQIYRSSSAATGQNASGGAGKKVPPEKRVMLRQRSKSLIQRSVALSEEKSIIKLLCDYSETAKSKQRLLRDNRRHSEV